MSVGHGNNDFGSSHLEVKVKVIGKWIGWSKSHKENISSIPSVCTFMPLRLFLYWGGNRVSQLIFNVRQGEKYRLSRELIWRSDWRIVQEQLDREPNQFVTVKECIWIAIRSSDENLHYVHHFIVCLYISLSIYVGKIRCVRYGLTNGKII